MATSPQGQWRHKHFLIFEQLTLKPFDKQEAEKFVQVKSTQVGFTEQERQQRRRMT